MFMLLVCILLGGDRKKIGIFVLFELVVEVIIMALIFKYMWDTTPSVLG